MDIKSVRELIDRFTKFLKPWQNCDECQVWNYLEEAESAIGRKFDCDIDCKDCKFQNLEDNFINYLIIRLTNKLKDSDNPDNELEILKLLYQIYRDNISLKFGSFPHYFKSPHDRILELLGEKEE